MSLLLINLLKSFNNSDKNKSLAELGWGPGRELESLTRMDSDDWKMQRRNPSRKGKPMDWILVRNEFIVWERKVGGRGRGSEGRGVVKGKSEAARRVKDRTKKRQK